MDNRGNRIIVSDTDSAINTPAVGAAHVVNTYAAKAPDELSLEVTISLSVMVIMASLCNRAGHYIFALWFLLSYGRPM